MRDLPNLGVLWPPVTTVLSKASVVESIGWEIVDGENKLMMTSIDNTR